MSKLTISIVTYNGADVIDACLKSLQQQDFEDYELIIVDNHSSDDTLTKARQLFASAKIIALDSNVGFGAGHNIAIAQAKSDWVLVLNQDVELAPDALSRLYEQTLRGDVAAIGPCLMRDKAKEKLDTAGLDKSWYYHFSDRGAGQAPRDSWMRAGYVWGISGACVLLRVSALRQIAYKTPQGAEYFDASFFLYKEDIDLCLRLRRAGWKCWYEPQALGYHRRTGRAPAKAASITTHRRSMPAYVRQYSYRNHWFVLLKHAPLIALFALLPFELVKALFILITEPRTLKYSYQVITRLPQLVKRRYA